jgi:hypothetical protein
MKLTSGTTLGNLAIPDARNLSQFYGSGGQMSKGRVAPASLKAYGGMVSDYMMDNIALPLKGLPQKRMARGGKKHMMPDGTMMLNSAKAKGGKVSKLAKLGATRLKRGGRPTKL